MRNQPPEPILFVFEDLAFFITEFIGRTKIYWQKSPPTLQNADKKNKRVFLSGMLCVQIRACDDNKSSNLR